MPMLAPPNKALQLTGHNEIQSTHGIVWHWEAALHAIGQAARQLSAMSVGRRDVARAQLSANQQFASKAAGSMKPWPAFAKLRWSIIERGPL